MNILLRITPFLFLLLVLTKPAFGQHWQWATKIDGPLAQYGFDIAVDPSGNSYVTGSFGSRGNFYGSSVTGNISLINNGNDPNIRNRSDLFIAKYNPDGKIIWAKQVGGPGYDVARGIAIDAAGNSYMTGTYSGQAYFGDFTLESTGSADRDIFIAKFDPQGKVLWARQIGGKENNGNAGLDDGYDVAVDAQGNSYITGAVAGNTQIDHISLTARGQQVFVAKFDPDGRVVWAHLTQSDRPGFSEGNALGVDPFGNCYVTGRFHFNTSFGNITLSNDRFDHDIFLAKYGPDGKLAWAKKAGGLANDYGQAIGVDALGNSYVAGTCPSAAMFDTLALKSISGTYGIGFLAKYNADGEALWVKRTESINGTDLAVAVDAAGEPYLAGTHHDKEQTDQLIATTTTNLIIAKYDPNGQEKWAKKALGSIGFHPLGLGVDRNNACYVTGSFFTVMSSFRTMFDAFMLESLVFDAFVAKLDLAAPGLPTLFTDPLPARTLCAGAEVGVSFSAGNQLPSGTTFAVQLSDPTGSFVGPTTIGTGAASPIRAIIPAKIPFGTAYRIRVIASAQPYSVAGTDNGAPITIHSLPGAPVPISATRCGPGPVTLQASGASGQQSYRWYTSITGNSTIADADQGTFITPVLTATTTYYVSLVNENGCESPRVAVKAILEPIPLVNAGPAVSVCLNSASFFLSAYSPAGGTWSGPGTNAAGIFNPAAAGTGAHVLTYTIRSGACTVSSTRTISVTALQPLPQAAEITLCPSGTPVSLADGYPPGGRWQGPGVTPTGLFIPSPGLIGTHTLTYSWQTGPCSNTATRIVTVSTPPAIAAAAVLADCGTPNLMVGMAPFTTRFINNTSGATGFLWDFGDGSTSTERVPSHSYTRPGHFKIFLTSFYGNGCSQKIPVTAVDVKEQRPVPNIITPNDDGLNDTFSLSLTCLPVDLKLFNRYGKIVFEKADYRNTWKGEHLANGTYYYLITTSKGMAWKGWVEINR
jgi:gliding motility-associated-like protein